MQFPDVMGGHDGPGFPGGGIEIHAGGPGIEVEIGDGIGGGRFGAYALDLVANTIGISAPDLLDQLADGSTVAEIATAAGADPQAVIDALVADTQERLAAAVQSGRITQAEADERLEDATERITNFVNGERPSTDEADRRRDAGEHRDGVRRDDRDHDRLSRRAGKTIIPPLGDGDRASPVPIGRVRARRVRRSRGERGVGLGGVAPA